MTERPAEIAGALIAWYAAMGVDSAVADPATDWLQRPRTPPRRASDILPAPNSRPLPIAAAPGAPAQAPTPRIPSRAPPQDQDAASEGLAAVTEAGTLASAATSLAELRGAIEGFDGCPLKKTARKMCFMRGAEQARLMVIGEAPGRDEDRSGLPFVGRAGQLLDKMLAAIDHGEANTHITNIVYWRPPGNRTPNDAEAQVCRPFLERQIALVDPDVILLMGGSAAKLMTGQTAGIMRMRGKPLNASHGGRERILMPTLHPAYLLRQPAEKRKAWHDLQAVRDTLARP